ncbi:MAG TPA: class I SAM-dependent methyltransferase [Solirubrobacteraceae bacterium]|nr:class I SAM-dependent methyltransferase [Solirubrobacteraceae bacterium]
MREYYEDLWERLPDERELPDLQRRMRFLRGELRGGERVLDLGCGAGEFTAAIAAGGAEPVGLEVAEAAVALACRLHPDLDFRLAGIDQELPLGDESFDVVWASEVIEHVADTGLWLREIRRVLVPGGRLLLTTPSHGRLRLLLGGIERYSEPLGDHLHLYTRRSLRAVLDAFDFADARVRIVGGPPLLKRMLLARAIKPSV